MMGTVSLETLTIIFAAIFGGLIMAYRSYQNGTLSKWSQSDGADGADRADRDDPTERSMWGERPEPETLWERMSDETKAIRGKSTRILVEELTEMQETIDETADMVAKVQDLSEQSEANINTLRERQEVLQQIIVVMHENDADVSAEELRDQMGVDSSPSDVLHERQKPDEPQTDWEGGGRDEDGQDGD